MSAHPAAPGGPDRERIARRRAAIRRHHPDVGGCAEELVAALEAVDRQPVVVITLTVRGRVRRFIRRRRGHPARNLK